MNHFSRALLVLISILAGVTLHAQVANFTASPPSGCAPLVVNFTSTSTGTISSYLWNFGNSATSSFQNPSTTYTSPGTYTVSLKVTGPSGSSNTKTSTITVYPPPTVSFTFANSSGCAPHTSTFTSSVTPNTSGPLTYSWVFGDGTGSPAPNPSHTYLTGGTYSVTLMVQNGQGCSQTVSQSSIITVFPRPTGGFGANKTSFCSTPAYASFSASSITGAAPVNIGWDFGDGGTGSGPAPNHTYMTAGTFTVKMFLTDAKGCKDTIVQPAYISVSNHAATFTAPIQICQSDTPKPIPPPSLYPPLTPCLPIPTYSLHGAVNKATFTNTTPGANTSMTFWDYGDGFKDTGATVQHAYYKPGNDTVRMITDVGGCYDTAYKVIIVHPHPNVSFTYGSPNCPAPASVPYTASGAVSYQWTWSNGATATGANPTRYYTHDEFRDSVILVGTDANGCKDTLITLAPIYGATVTYLGPIKGCAPLDMDVDVFLNSSLTCDGKYPSAIKSVYWDFGDGSFSNQKQTSHTYLKPGIYYRVATITSNNGCILKDTVKIKVGSQVKPSFTIHPDTVCVKTEVYFTNTTPNAPDSSLTYEWEVGQGYNFINQRDAITKYIYPGTYTIVLRVDSNGCVDSIVCPDCVVVRPSNAQFIDSVYCSPNALTVKFLNQSIGATTNIWNFGDGGTSTTPSPVHTYAQAGTYNVTLVTHNNIYGCRDTLTIPVYVPGVTMNFVASDTTLCLGETLTLTPTFTSNPSKVLSYTWAIDDHSILLDSLMRPIYYVINPRGPANFFGLDSPIIGRHDVSYRIVRQYRGSICVDTLRKNNYLIVSKPNPKFSVGPLIGCAPLTVTLSDSSTATPGTSIASKTWVFGNGDTMSSSTVTSSYTYTKPGLFTVRLKLKDSNGCSDSLNSSSYVDVRQPDADFIVNRANSCAYRPLSFTNLSQPAIGLNFTWDFGDGDTSNVLHPQHSYKNPGTYTVRLIARDQMGCVDTFVQSNLINITRPTASFTMSDSVAVCPPLVVQFNSTSTNATNYYWDFANNDVSIIASPLSSFNAAGLYAVRLIAEDANHCQDTAYRNVRVLGYSGALSYTPLKGCAPLEVNFTSSVTNVPIVLWDFSDGDIDTAIGNTTTHIYATPGKYVPKLIFTDGPKCASSSIGLDTIRVDGIIAGFKVNSPCEKSQVQLVDTSYSYFSPLKNSRWDFGGSGIMTGNPVTRTYAAPGTYPVTLIATNDNGCKDTLVTTVTIFPLPVVIAPPDTSICLPDAIQLEATGAKTYSWSPAAGLSCSNCAKPIANPSSAISYVVTGTDSNGCVNIDTVRVGMQTKSTFVTAKDGEICLGQSFQLFAAGATLYSWTPAATLNNPEIANPLASPKVNTTYIVTGREGSCLPDTHIVHVVVRPLPVVDAGGDLKVIAGNAVLLQASGTGIVRLVWQDDPSLSCTVCYAPEARPKVSTTYKVTGYNEYGCASTDSVRVQVICDGSQLFIPNSFTPNADGINDFFFPRGQGLDHINAFRVYSRWGELLFERTNMALNDEFAGWNGTHNGRKLNPDVYVYVIEATCDTGEPIRFKGDVTLIR